MSHRQVFSTSVKKKNYIVLVCYIIKILLAELSRSTCENLDLGHVYRPHCIRSVLTTSVNILAYRPPARLIRAKLRKAVQQKSNCVNSSIESSHG